MMDSFPTSGTRRGGHGTIIATWRGPGVGDIPYLVQPRETWGFARSPLLRTAAIQAGASGVSGAERGRDDPRGEFARSSSRRTRRGVRARWGDARIREGRRGRRPG